MAQKKTTTKKAVKKKATKKVRVKKQKTIMLKNKANNTKQKNKKTIQGDAIGAQPKVLLGDTVPDLKLLLTGNKEVALSSLKGKKILLYFYPKDATPGCTLQGHEFTRLHEQFKKLNTEVYGVSRDTMKSHENFKKKHCYSIDLASDESEELCQIFGVIKMKNMYGKQVRGIERSTFLIDETGKLTKQWRGVKAEGHAEEVLKSIQ